MYAVKHNEGDPKELFVLTDPTFGGSHIVLQSIRDSDLLQFVRIVHYVYREGLRGTI